MQLFYSALSPFARKVRVVAWELGLADRLELVAVNPWTDETYKAVNPLGQVPALVLGDGTRLYDSRVICEALIAMAASPLPLVPPRGPARWAALSRQALSDGMGAAAIRIVRERFRPEDDRQADAVDYQRVKLVAGLDDLEAGSPFQAFTVGEIAVGCLLGWLDVRAVLDWREGRPRLAAWYAAVARRPSFLATAPELPT